MAQETPIVIKSREELVFLLSEAAMLEHMIMCEYLFAAFSLKQDVSEGITDSQLTAIKRWERSVSHVATQEMLHLALVNNLLSALGAMPFLSHPNFPQRSKYFPSTVQLALLPFGEDALQHFLYLERPEGMDLQDAPEFAILTKFEPSIALDDDQIVPEPQQFATVGHLYRGIEQGFRYLVDKYGEERVFVGPSRAQATQQYFSWPELVSVTDLASAVQAIETIVEQGEGARGHWQTSHFGTFFTILQEYQALKQQDPNFEPARPAVACYVRPDSDTSEVILISNPLTAGVSELFNACYELMLQVLVRYFIHGSDNEDELRTLSDVAVDAMFSTIKPLGKLLTKMPVGQHLPGKLAGPGFEIYQIGYYLPHRHAAWIIFHERLLEIASFCHKVSTQPSAPAELGAIEENIKQLASALEPHINASKGKDA